MSVAPVNKVRTQAAGISAALDSRHGPDTQLASRCNCLMRAEARLRWPVQDLALVAAESSVMKQPTGVLLKQGQMATAMQILQGWF